MCQMRRRERIFDRLRNKNLLSSSNHYNINMSSPGVVMTSIMQVHESQLNTSTSKQQFSFPRQKRFELEFKPKFAMIWWVFMYICSCSSAFYDLPTVSSTRRTNFGYGRRSDFTKKPMNPAATDYEIKRLFEHESAGTKFARDVLAFLPVTCLHPRAGA